MIPMKTTKTVGIPMRQTHFNDESRYQYKPKLPFVLCTEGDPSISDSHDPMRSPIECEAPVRYLSWLTKAPQDGAPQL